MYILYINGNIFVIPPQQTILLSKNRIQEKKNKGTFKDSSILGEIEILTKTFLEGNFKTFFLKSGCLDTNKSNIHFKHRLNVSFEVKKEYTNFIKHINIKYTNRKNKTKNEKH